MANICYMYIPYEKNYCDMNHTLSLSRMSVLLGESSQELDWCGHNVVELS